jgi:acyl-CoA synthetase (AMP-forming)/AMP-acid ligase II
MNSTLLTSWTTTVRSAPAAVAVTEVATGLKHSRAELDERAEAWREAYGAGLAGKTVMLAEPNGAEWFRVFLGLLKADAVVVPLDPGEPIATQQETARALRAGWLWSGGQLHVIAVGARRRRDRRRLIKLTSGSTGRPRALAFTDAQMLADGAQVCAGMGIRPDDVNFGLIPFGHSYGLGNLVLPLLIQGTAIVAGTAALPHAMADAIAEWRPTIFPAVPALLQALVVSEIATDRLASLRTIISAGAPLSSDTAAAFRVKFGRAIHSFYGSSETGGITYDRTGEAASTGRSVGTPLPGVRLVFGKRGRFTLESAAVFTLGNRRRGEGGGGAYQPADIAELRTDGELVLRGRAGRFVKIAGRRLNLAEVERALKSLPGVRDALVAPHGGRADALAAVVATDEPGASLRTQLRERLAPWKIPKRIVVLPEFPVTARGKPDTRRLREQLDAE